MDFAFNYYIYKEYVLGYKLKGHEYLVFNKKEIDSAKPESSKVIDLDKFVILVTKY